MPKRSTHPASVPGQANSAWRLAPYHRLPNNRSAKHEYQAATARCPAPHFRIERGQTNSKTLFETQALARLPRHFSSKCAPVLEFDKKRLKSAFHAAFHDLHRRRCHAYVSCPRDFVDPTQVATRRVGYHLTEGRCSQVARESWILTEILGVGRTFRTLSYWAIRWLRKTKIFTQSSLPCDAMPWPGH